MFRRLLLAAVLGAIPASLALTASQALWTTPLILQAEVFETGLTGNPGPVVFDWIRLLQSAMANLMLALGYGLMLCGLYTLKRPSGVIHGLGWGVAGLGVFFVAPAIGLPPELPGTETASLISRQAWWLVTVICTATGLSLLFFQTRVDWRLTGLGFLFAPHLAGVPQPEVAGSLAPEALINQFRWMTLVCNALFWLSLGSMTAVAFLRQLPDSERGAD